MKTYCLLIRVRKDVCVKTRKKNFKLEKGLYLYVGSGKRGLEKRLERHLKRKKKLFWHIDFLLDHPQAEIEKIFLSPLEECELAKKVSKSGIPVSGFGSSDCKCESHLFRVQTLPGGLREWSK